MSFIYTYLYILWFFPLSYTPPFWSCLCWASLSRKSVWETQIKKSTGWTYKVILRLEYARAHARTHAHSVKEDEYGEVDGASPGGIVVWKPGHTCMCVHTHLRKNVWSQFQIPPTPDVCVRVHAWAAAAPEPAAGSVESSEKEASTQSATVIWHI